MATPEPTRADAPQQAVEYRDCPGLPGYQVGDDGSAWSCVFRFPPRAATLRDGKWLRVGFVDRLGRVCVATYVNGRRIPQGLHRLVLEAFVGPCPPGMECCHRDGNPLNNALSNLRWDTPQSNAADRIRHGRAPRGSKNGFARLTESDVATIKRLLSQGLTHKSIAARFGVDRTTVSLIKRGKGWSHVQ